MLTFADSLTQTAPSSLVDVVVSTIGLTDVTSGGTHKQKLKFVQEMVKMSTLKELEQSTKNSASALQALVDASEELADRCGDVNVNGFLRDCFIQQAISSLQISDNNVEEEVRRLLRGEETLVQVLTEHPDKVALGVIKILADKDEQLFKRERERWRGEEPQEMLSFFH